MRRWWTMLIFLMLTSPFGCGADDDDDVAEVKKAIPMEQVPAPVLKTAKEAAPGLTFFAAYLGKFDGKDSIELKGRTRSGQIKELELTPEGKLLGTE